MGHTHEDIDAKFSRIAEMLRQQDAATVGNMVSLIPNCTELTSMYDIRSWMEPHIIDIRKHTKPFHYKFVRNAMSVDVFYKGLFDMPWKLLPSGGSMFITVQGNVQLPSGCPSLVIPDFEVNVKPESLLKASKHWKLALDNECNMWWQRYISNLTAVSKSLEQRKSYAKYGAKWLLPDLPKQVHVSNIEHDDDDDAISPAIQQLLATETQEPQIEVTKQKMNKSSKTTAGCRSKRGRPGTVMVGGRGRGNNRQIGSERVEGRGRQRGVGRAIGVVRGRGVARVRVEGGNRCGRRAGVHGLGRGQRCHSEGRSSSVGTVHGEASDRSDTRNRGGVRGMGKRRGRRNGRNTV